MEGGPLRPGLDDVLDVDMLNCKAGLYGETKI